MILRMLVVEQPWEEIVGIAIESFTTGDRDDSANVVSYASGSCSTVIQ